MTATVCKTSIQGIISRLGNSDDLVGLACFIRNDYNNFLLLRTTRLMGTAESTKKSLLMTMRISVQDLDARYVFSRLGNSDSDDLVSWVCCITLRAKGEREPPPLASRL